MSNPFDDLETDDTEEGNAGGPTDDESSSTSPTPDPEPTPTTRGESTESDPADSGPAFEYSEVRQRPVYAPGESWDEFERYVRTVIGPKLVEADVIDEETREVHDALVQLGNEQPERVAELLIEARWDS